MNQLPPDLVLRSGAHPSPDAGMCVMEAVAFVAGEPHTDSPACACPVLAAFLRRWNDDIPDDETRTRLLTPLIPALVGSRSTPAVESARVWAIIDWHIREFLPAFLDLVPALADHAAAIRALPPQISEVALSDSTAARDVAEAAAGAAAGAAAWDAARAAAWAAALQPTISAVQQSAVALVLRLAAMREVSP